MTPATLRRWIDRILRWMLGIVFVAAAVGIPGTAWGTGKIVHPSSFVKNIHTYKMVPEPLVFPMAMYLPWLELSTGLCLLVGLWRRQALWVTFLVCAAFLTANLIAMARGLQVDCGCFGSGYHGSAAREAVLSIVMLFMAICTIRVIPPPVRQGSHA